MHGAGVRPRTVALAVFAAPSTTIVGVNLVMDELAEHSLPKYKRPPYPNYHQQIMATNGGE